MNREEIIKFVKNKNNLTVIIILIIGVVLMTAFGGQKKDIKSSQKGADEEVRLGEILSKIEGVGEVSVMISYEDNEKGEGERPAGIVVAARGADNPKVKTAIYRAAEASLNIGANRICILKKEEE